VPLFPRQLPPSTVSTQPPNRETLTCGQHSDVPCSLNHTTVQYSTYILFPCTDTLFQRSLRKPSSCSTQETLLSHTVVQAEDTPVIVHTALIGGVGQEEEGEEVDAYISYAHTPHWFLPSLHNHCKRTSTGDRTLLRFQCWLVMPFLRYDLRHETMSVTGFLLPRGFYTRKHRLPVWCHIRGVKAPPRQAGQVRLLVEYEVTLAGACCRAASTGTSGAHGRRPHPDTELTSLVDEWCMQCAANFKVKKCRSRL
jgi:hypothetical protein